MYIYIYRRKTCNYWFDYDDRVIWSSLKHTSWNRAHWFGIERLRACVPVDIDSWGYHVHWFDIDSYELSTLIADEWYLDWYRSGSSFTSTAFTTSRCLENLDILFLNKCFLQILIFLNLRFSFDEFFELGYTYLLFYYNPI